MLSNQPNMKCTSTGQTKLASSYHPVHPTSVASLPVCPTYHHATDLLRLSILRTAPVASSKRT